jgi:hypothetical protein
LYLFSFSKSDPTTLIPITFYDMLVSGPGFKLDLHPRAISYLVDLDEN